MQNFVQEGKHLHLAVTDPATPASGDPVRIGRIVGVAITNEGDGGNASDETSRVFRGKFVAGLKRAFRKGELEATCSGCRQECRCGAWRALVGPGYKRKPAVSQSAQRAM